MEEVRNEFIYLSFFSFLDEVSSLVFDLGSFNCRVGYSGEDSPKCVFQPVIGVSGNSYQMSEANLRFFKENCKVFNFMNKNGTIEDYTLYEKMVDDLLAESLHVEIKEHPILFSEPSLHNKDHRIKLTEFMFEKYNIPALFICKNAVLSAFSCGRSTCLVFDSGHSTTYAVPVHDGYALQKSLMKSDIAGDFITNLVREKIESKNIETHPFYKLNKTKVEDHYVTEINNEIKADPSYENYWKGEIFRDMKENCLLTCEDVIPYNAENDSFTVTTMAQSISYDLPDGNTVELAEDRMLLLERVFNTVKNHPGFNGYHQMITDAINKADLDIRKELYSNIFVCGGNTLFTNFPERLQKQLSTYMNQNIRLKLITHPSTTERKFSTWIGGSILSSLGTFHQLWLSKQEFEEHGAMIIERKCV